MSEKDGKPLALTEYAMTIDQLDKVHEGKWGNWHWLSCHLTATQMLVVNCHGYTITEQHAGSKGIVIAKGAIAASFEDFLTVARVHPGHEAHDYVEVKNAYA